MLSAGISETVPMWKSPEPVPVISRAALEVSAFDVKLKGNFWYSLVSGKEAVCAIIARRYPTSAKRSLWFRECREDKSDLYIACL